MSAEGPSVAGRRPLVLHVLEAVEGGTARHVSDVARAVPEVSHVVVVPERRVGGLTDAEAAARMRAAGAEVVHVPMTRAPLTLTNASAVASLRRTVRRLRPDVVHSHSSIAGVLGRVSATGTGARRVYTPHALATGRMALAIERSLGPLTDVLVACSESEAGMIRARRLVPPERIVVVPNGIDLAPVPPAVPGLQERLGLPPGTRLVGSVARLIAQKSPEHFVAACGLVGAARADVHFVLIGGGPMEAVVREAVVQAGLGGRFHLRADVPHAAALLGDLDVFVLASRFEGGPYAPLEAMRAGTPVVLSDVVGNRDVVEAGVSGDLVAWGDVASLAAAVGRLLDDADLRSARVRAGRDRLAERFDLRLMGKRLGQVYGLDAEGTPP